MHSQQPPGVVQNWSTLQCSKQNTEQCGYDHAPVTRGRMRAQFPLPHGLFGTIFFHTEPISAKNLLVPQKPPVAPPPPPHEYRHIDNDAHSWRCCDGILASWI